MRASPRVTGALVALVSAAVGLSGCAVPNAVVGVHDAPTESPTGAPISGDSAERITLRVLTAAAEARVAGGKKAEDQRKAAFTGPALEEAQVKAAYREQTGVAAGAIVKPTEPTVLAISRSRAWPRAILATTLDDDGVQRLQVLTSASATEPFKLFASVSMQPGATVPAVGPIGEGSPLVTSGDGIVASPEKALKAYGEAIAFPAPKKTPDFVSTDDAFATTLAANAKDQEKRLKDLGKLRRWHRLDPKSVIAFRLQDGSVLAFGQLTRTDRIRTTSDAKKLVLPANLAALAGRKDVSKELKISALETIAMHVPTEGQFDVVGADEQMTSVQAN